MTCIATYNVQVVITDKISLNPISWNYRMTTPRVLANLPAMMEAIEEDLTKLLPPGYSAVIREWSSDE